jgi:hypothetical protein
MLGFRLHYFVFPTVALRLNATSVGCNRVRGVPLISLFLVLVRTFQSHGLVPYHYQQINIRTEATSTTYS